MFKKGKITRSDGVSFSYELGDYMRPRIDDEGDLELFASVQTMTELTWCPINHEWMTKLVEEKFKKMFGINIELTPPRESNLVKWTGKKPWDKEEPTEPTELNEETDKLRDKTKNVYSAFKEGMFIDKRTETNLVKVKYVLPDEYGFSPSSLGDREVPSIILNRKDVNFYYIKPNGETQQLKYMSDFEFLKYFDKIQTKFNHFNINLSIR